MIAGHFATGMALSAGHPSRSALAYGLLLLGAMLADLMWCVLTLIGIEGGFSLGDLAQHRPRLPWSHSLAPTLLWTVLYAGFCLGIARAAGFPAPGRLALLAGLSVALHWLVGDLPVGTGFFLTPAMRIEVPSLHLYAHPPTALLLEAVFCVAAWALYARSVGGRTSPAALAGLALLIGLQVFMSLPLLAGNPSVNLDEHPTRILAYLVPSVVAIAVFTAVHAVLARRGSAST